MVYNYSNNYIILYYVYPMILFSLDFPLVDIKSNAFFMILWSLRTEFLAWNDSSADAFQKF